MLKWLISLAWAIRYWWLDRQRKRLVTLREERRRQQWDLYFARDGQW